MGDSGTQDASPVGGADAHKGGAARTLIRGATLATDGDGQSLVGGARGLFHPESVAHERASEGTRLKRCISASSARSRTRAPARALAPPILLGASGIVVAVGARRAVPQSSVKRAVCAAPLAAQLWRGARWMAARPKLRDRSSASGAAASLGATGSPRGERYGDLVQQRLAVRPLSSPWRWNGT